MSVDVQDCLEPDGPIPLTLFAGETPSLEERIEAAIVEALARPEYANIDEADTFTQDSAVKRWVEYRIWGARTRQMAETANVQSFTLNDQGSVTLANGAAFSTPYGKTARNALRGWQMLTAAADIGTPYRGNPIYVVES